MGLFSSLFGIGAANDKEDLANGMLSSGKADEKDAWAKRKDYTVSPEVQTLYNKDVAASNAPSTEQQAIDSQADAGASYLADSIRKNSTSTAQAVAGATIAEQQRQAGYRTGAIAGAQQQNINRQNLGNSTQALNHAKDQAYELNVQQPFELNYQKSQNEISAGYQGKVAAIDQKAKSWGGLFDGVLGDALGAIF
jgi:hypothetical protein